MTHKQICSKGGKAKSPAKTKAGQVNLAKAREVLKKQRESVSENGADPKKERTKS
jgi:hypothetical protein